MLHQRRLDVADDMSDGVAAQPPARFTEGSHQDAPEAIGPAVADDTTAMHPISFRDPPGLLPNREPRQYQWRRFRDWPRQGGIVCGYHWSCHN